MFTKIERSIFSSFKNRIICWHSWHSWLSKCNSSKSSINSADDEHKNSLEQKFFFFFFWKNYWQSQVSIIVVIFTSFIILWLSFSVCYNYYGTLLNFKRFLHIAVAGLLFLKANLKTAANEWPSCQVITEILSRSISIL